MEHDEYMRLALREAMRGENGGEVPAGAVLVAADGKVVAKAHNRTIETCDPTAHAEILALRRASKRLGNYRLVDLTLYATLEPCVMCMGAIIHARIRRLVFGTSDSRWGAAGSLYDFTKNPKLNHRPEVVAGICEEACRNMLQTFFKARR